MKKPNIIMILADDMGSWAMGCAGNSDVKTPNLDGLAKEGMLFENFFCTSPVCSPARASILSGKMPSQHGVHDWISRGHINYEDVSDELKKMHNDPNASWEYNWSKNQLQGDHAIRYMDEFNTYTELLADNGYTCGLSGKWHLGDAKTPQKGFSYWKTIAMGGDNYYYPTVLKDDKFEMLRDTYITEYITDHALAFLEDQTNENPFYLSVHYTAPHASWEEHQHPKEFYEMYDECEFAQTPNVEHHKWGASYTKEQRKENLQGYYAAISAMDYGIGTIVNHLKENNLWDNTIIMFTSDNGMSMGHHGIFGKGNGTFPLNMYDTAVKVPAIISYPNELTGGSIARGLYSHYDIMLTIAKLLNIKLDHSYPGTSFDEIFSENFSGGENPIVIFDEYGSTRMIRTTEYKYIHRYPYGENEFYCLLTDSDEEHNLIDEPNMSDKILNAKKSMEAWFIQHTDPSKDGTKEAVYGSGQLDLVGENQSQKHAFVNLDG